MTKIFILTLKPLILYTKEEEYVFNEYKKKILDEYFWDALDENKSIIVCNKKSEEFISKDDVCICNFRSAFINEDDKKDWNLDDNKFLFIKNHYYASYEFHEKHKYAFLSILFNEYKEYTKNNFKI